MRGRWVRGFCLLWSDMGSRRSDKALECWLSRVLTPIAKGNQDWYVTFACSGQTWGWNPVTRPAPRCWLSSVLTPKAKGD